MWKYLMALVIAVISIWLAATVFAESVWEGPVLLTICLFTTLYGLFGLASRNETCRLVIRWLVELLFGWV